MRTAPQYEFTREQTKALHQARFLEYITIAYLMSVIILMYLVMGSSQAMKTAWYEDLLSLIPPISFLVGSWVCWRKPTKHFPYGFHRTVSVFYLVAALALLGMGGFLFIEAVTTLIKSEHPTIGMRNYFGADIWLGWWMISVLLWGTFPPVFLGLKKLKLSKILNDKILYTDGKMNKADWMTAIAAISGILGIGMGWWWADAVAAGIISIDILIDGWRQSRDAITGLMNRAPTAMDNGYLDLPERIQAHLMTYPWIEEAEIRLYEHGHLIFGEGFIRTPEDVPLIPAQMCEVISSVYDMDWRMQGFALTVMP